MIGVRENILEIWRLNVNKIRKREVGVQKDHVDLESFPLRYLAFLDFEATCVEYTREYNHEIIEFPVILVDMHNLSIVDRFQRFVRPTEVPILSDFCKSLTSITQEDVDLAHPIEHVLRELDEWLDSHHLLEKNIPHIPNVWPYSFAFATDGPWDLASFLYPELTRKGLFYPDYCNEWLDIRKEFSGFYHVRPGNIGSMLCRLGLEFLGSPHRGIDDSMMVGRICMQMVLDGYVPSRLSNVGECLVALREKRIRRRRGRGRGRGRK